MLHVALVVLVVAACTPGGGGSAPRHTEALALAARLHVAAGGSGENCTPNDVCGSLTAAVDAANDGDVIGVAPGHYGLQRITTRHTASFTKGIVIAGDGASSDVVFAGILIRAPRITVRHITSTDTIYVGPGADGSGFDDVTAVAASAFISSSDAAFLTNSRVTPPPDGDALQIKTDKGVEAQGVRVNHNVLGPTSRGPERGHVDCIQILGGSDIEITDNHLISCASQGIIAGDGASGHVGTGLRIERNIIEMCADRGAACGGTSAVNITAPDLVFAANTLLGGSAHFAGGRRVVTQNYFSYLSSCEGAVGNFYGDSACRGVERCNTRSSTVVPMTARTVARLSSGDVVRCKRPAR